MSLEVHMISHPLQITTSVSNCKPSALYLSLSWLTPSAQPPSQGQSPCLSGFQLPCHLWILSIIYLCVAVVIFALKNLSWRFGTVYVMGQILHAKILCWLEALQLPVKNSRAAAMLDEDLVLSQARELRVMHRSTELMPKAVLGWPSLMSLLHRPWGLPSSQILH